MERGTLTITVIVCMILAVVLHITLEEGEKKDVIIDYYNTELSVSDSLKNAQSNINIRMRQFQCKKCEQALIDDSVYMEEVAKIY